MFLSIAEKREREFEGQVRIDQHVCLVYRVESTPIGIEKKEKRIAYQNDVSGERKFRCDFSVCSSILSANVLTYKDNKKIF